MNKEIEQINEQLKDCDIELELCNIRDKFKQYVNLLDVYCRHPNKKDYDNVFEIFCNLIVLINVTIVKAKLNKELYKRKELILTTQNCEQEK